MRHRPIQTAPRERVPFTLWGHKRIRQTLATVAAAAAGLIPVMFVGSPAYAAAADSLTITPTSNWEGGSLTFKLTYTGATTATFTYSYPGGTATGAAALDSLGTDTKDYNNSAATTTTGALASCSVAAPCTATLTVATADDAGTTDETVVLRATAADGSSKEATATIWAKPASARTVSISAPPTVAESAGSVTVVASLSGVVSGDVSLPVSAVTSTTHGTGTDAVSTGGPTRDFTALAYDATIAIPAGQTSGSVTIPINDDNVDEADTQYLTVATQAYAITNVVTGTATTDIGITDNDAAPTVSIENAPATTDAATQTAAFPIKLTGLSEKELRVKITTASGVDAATTRGAVGGGTDFADRAAHEITIPPFTQTAYGTVSIVDDAVVEGTETFTVSLGTSAAPYTVALGASTTATGTITDDPTTIPTVDVNTNTPAITEQELDSGTPADSVPFSVSFGTLQTPVKLDYTFVDGTATNGVDYKGTNGTITIPTSATSPYNGTIPFTKVGDTTFEGDETFNIKLSSSNNSITAATLASQEPVITLTESGETDAASKPTWTVGDISVKEGDSGTTLARVPIRLNGKTGGPVTFTGSFGGSPSATEGGVNSGSTVGDDDFDFPTSYSVIVPAGETTGYLEFPVKGDTVFERDESLTVTVSSVSTLTNNTTPTSDISHESRVAITNDDAAPTFAFNPSSGSEGTSLRISGKVTGVSQYPYDLTFATAAAAGDNAATPIADFDVPTSIATLSVARGETGTTFVDTTPPLTGITDIYLAPDDIDEPTETFNVTATETTASPVGIPVSTGAYRINDDPGDLPPSASIRDESIGENEGSVDVHVDFTPNGDATKSTQTILIPWETGDGSAKKGEDYEYGKGVLTVTPGTTQAKINVEILDDKLKESEENFYVKLGTPTTQGATVTTSVGEVTIKSDDVANPVTPTLTVTGPAKGVGPARFMGTAAPNTTVDLWGSPLPNTDPAEMEQLSTVNANDDGYFEFAPRSIAAGWAFVVRSQEINSAVKTVKVTQLPSFSASSPKKGKLGVSVAGNPRTAGQAVTVQRYTGGKWVTVGKGVTTATGWKGTFSFKSKTKLTLRAKVTGNASLGINTGYSGTKKVTVK
ncbi:Calx-beta domain-containing protein [Actinoplanes sp. NEAU-A12]|uniref:Calx-beta domain-containing protein n=1 Tax=Actinoplanes sandaracinus TaxID=3045177 RepID=A0ABT6WNM6_9ACTN|nr:Calx-beta domain-containing protein [Actinoplanes sandaracinus]MDI6101311.1 Calx-beta domain-containing protein [Actinoplanes sandaracinus]